jgi:hypothetical protein
VGTPKVDLAQCDPNHMLLRKVLNEGDLVKRSTLGTSSTFGYSTFHVLLAPGREGIVHS